MNKQLNASKRLIRKFSIILSPNNTQGFIEETDDLTHRIFPDTLKKQRIPGGNYFAPSRTTVAAGSMAGGIMCAITAATDAFLPDSLKTLTVRASFTA